jgi:uncharacterized RDD family membrane protein YckC
MTYAELIDARYHTHSSPLFWRRFFAFVIDSTIVGWIVSMIANVYMVPSTNTSFPLISTTIITVVNIWIRNSWLLLIGVYITYATMMEWLFGYTIGKAVMKLRVIMVMRERTFKAIALRNIFRIIDHFFLLGGFIMLSSQMNQRLGDQAARTLVVGKENLHTSHHEPRWKFIVCAGVLVLLCSATFAFNYYKRPPLIIAGMYAARNEDPVTSAPFTPCVSGYTLGTPTWNKDTITYTVLYKTSQSTTQQGFITLRWQGFLTGWQQASSEGPSCPGWPQSYYQRI